MGKDGLAFRFTEYFPRYLNLGILMLLETKRQSNFSSKFYILVGVGIKQSMCDLRRDYGIQYLKSVLEFEY
jgi:hypothetical protein